MAVTFLVALVHVTYAQEPASQPANQAPPAAQDAKSTWRAELVGPAGSVFLPGLGQWLQRDCARGAFYQGVFVAGWSMSRAALDGRQVSVYDFRTFDGQTEWGVWALQLQATAGSMSAYDAFRQSLPRLQQAGKYEFEREPDHRGHVAPGRLAEETWQPIAAAHAVDFTGGRRGLDLAMAVYSASLGVNCLHCHMDGDWTDGSKRAHQMVSRMGMLFTVMPSYFEGSSRQPVTQCFMCHHGNVHVERE